MALPIFPTYPILMFEALEDTPQPNVRRTEMEGGLPKQAVKYTRQLVQTNVSYKLCGHTHNSEFRRWVRDTLKFGALWFMWTDPRLANAGTAIAPVSQRMVRIVSGQVKYAPMSKDLSHYKTSFTLEYMDTL
jgi:hypothetical protein